MPVLVLRVAMPCDIGSCIARRGHSAAVLLDRELYTELDRRRLERRLNPPPSATGSPKTQDPRGPDVHTG